MDNSFKVRLPWVGRGAILLIIVGAMLLGGCGGDDAALTTTTTVPSATTVPETTTTAVAPTTTVLGGIVAITVPTTTTTTTTAATTEAPPATVPATIAPAAAPDSVEFTNHGIYAGETWIYFGWDDEDTISAVTAVLGAPTSDLGWQADTICGPEEVRTVRWNDLLLLFTKADTDFWIGGVPHFFTYQYSGSTPELFTTEGIGLGSTLSDLDDAYGGPDLIITESPFVLGEGYWTYEDAPWTGMWGFATGQSPTHTVTAINGGAGCGE